MQYYFPELNIFDPTLRYDLDTSQNKYQQLESLREVGNKRERSFKSNRPFRL